MNILNVKPILKSIHEDTGAIIGTDLNFDDRYFSVYTLYPSVIINNDNEESLELKDFLFVSKLSVGYCKETKEIFLNGLAGLRGYNLSPTFEMARANYAHSHVSGLTSSTVCIGEGDNNILRQVFNKWRNNRKNLEEEDVYTFFFLLNSLAHYENLDGGPYAYISNVHDEDYSNEDQAEFDSNSIEDFIIDQGTSDDDVENIYYQWSNEVVNHLTEELKHNIKLYNDADNLDLLNPDFKKGIEKLSELCDKLTKDRRFDNGRLQYYSPRVCDEYDLNHNNMLETYKKFYCVFKHYYTEKFESNEDITLSDCIEQYGKLLNEEQTYFDFCVENITSTFYRLWNSSAEEYTDDVFSKGLLDIAGDYASNNSGKYSDIERQVDNLSFFIENKLYTGKCPNLSKLKQTNFELHEHTAKVWTIENLGHMGLIYQNVIGQKQNKNEAVTRDAYNFLKSYSSSD